MRVLACSLLAVAFTASAAIAQDSNTNCTWIGPPVNQMQCRTQTAPAPPSMTTPDPAGAMARGLETGAALGRAMNRPPDPNDPSRLSPMGKNQLMKLIEKGKCKEAVRLVVVAGSTAEYIDRIEKMCPLLSDKPAD